MNVNPHNINTQLVMWAYHIYCFKTGVIVLSKVDSEFINAHSPCLGGQL